MKPEWNTKIFFKRKKKVGSIQHAKLIRIMYKTSVLALKRNMSHICYEVNTFNGLQEYTVVMFTE